MKENRIKHQADILCKMFIGWQLQEDFNALSDMGNGVLLINVLDSTNKFNDLSQKSLNITTIINSWLNNDLIQNNIPTSLIKEAILKVEIQVKIPEYGSRFTNFMFQCNSNIATENKNYSSSLKDIQDFECKRI